MGGGEWGGWGAHTHTHTGSVGNCPSDVVPAACDPLNVGVVAPAGCEARRRRRWREDWAIIRLKCLAKKAVRVAASATAAGADKCVVNAPPAPAAPAQRCSV